MTEAEFVAELELILAEVNTAIECFYTYIEIHNYAAENKCVHRAMKDAADFWNINLYSLQATFFITLGRIFDGGTDAHSVHKLLSETVAHPEFFSKAALGARRTTGGPEPEWLGPFLQRAFEPDTKDLRGLKKSLAAHRSRYDGIYAKIRNLVFAHKIKTSPSEVAALFNQALVSDIDRMLYSLLDLLASLQQLVFNGRRPELGTQQYGYRQRIKESVRITLTRLIPAKAGA